MFWLSMSKRPLHLVSVTPTRHRHPKTSPGDRQRQVTLRRFTEAAGGGSSKTDLTADTKKNIPRTAMRMDVPGSNRCKWALRCRS